jgi:hypothetical protein
MARIEILGLIGGQLVAIIILVEIGEELQESATRVGIGLTTLGRRHLMGADSGRDLIPERFLGDNVSRLAEAFEVQLTLLLFGIMARDTVTLDKRQNVLLEGWLLSAERGRDEEGEEDKETIAHRWEPRIRGAQEIVAELLAGGKEKLS